MGLKDALTSLKNAVEDLSSLDVQTFTGTVDISANTDGFTGIRTLVEQAKTSGKVTLVAQSLYQFDGDSFNFLANGEGIPADALKMHTEAVQAGLKARQGLLNLFKDALG